MAISNGIKSCHKSVRSSAFENVPRAIVRKNDWSGKLADPTSRPFQRSYRIDHPGKLCRRDQRDNRRSENGGNLAFHKGGDQQPHSGGNDDIQQRRQGERQKLPLCGTPNTNTDRPQSRKKFSIPSAMYGNCLPSKIHYAWWGSRKG